MSDKPYKTDGVWIESGEHFYSMPDKPKISKLEKLKAELDKLTDDERLELFSNYCRGCGGKVLPCHCQNDE